MKKGNLVFGKKFLQMSSALLVTAGAVFFSAVPASAAVEYTLGFENYVSGTNTFFQGTVPAGTTEGNYSCQHEFNAPFGTISLNSEMANWGVLYPGFGYADSWSWGGGFTISNVNAENTVNDRTIVSGGEILAAPNYTSSNYFGAVAGTTNYPNENYSVTVGGSNGSDSYAVLFGSSAAGTTGGTISFEKPVSLKSLDFTNTVTVLAIDAFGDQFSAKASENNWAALIVQGWNSDGVQVGQKVLMLHDYLLGNDTVDEWVTIDFENFETKVYDAQYYGVDASDADYQKMLEDVASGIFSANDLPYLADGGSFTDISSLTFTFNGSDAGQWGLNFPVYAALDDLVFSWLGETDPDVPVIPGEPMAPGTNVPEPASWLLLVLAAALGYRKVKKH
ncbi:MAG: DUF4465 domain-containing protein [Planctomycetaceae bacterium]|nr:DUF4465 domain-containing protein [Planctomycetaceae bacterium]